ncbi:hypothetical protein ACWCQP_49900, partial [Streptomyces chartreusis]
LRLPHPSRDQAAASTRPRGITIECPGSRGNFTVDKPAPALNGLAMDGQTVRGSRTDGDVVHLSAAALHEGQAVIARRQVEAKSIEQ